MQLFTVNSYYLPLMKKFTVNKSQEYIQNYERLIKIFTINEYNLQLIKRLTVNVYSLTRSKTIK